MKLLKIIDERELTEYKSKSLELKRDEDGFLEEVASGIIDLFPHALTVEEMGTIAFDFENLNLRNEYKYINLFRRLFNECNNSKLFVRLEYRDLENYEHLSIIEELDRYHKHLWVNQMIYLDHEKVTDYFIVDDLDLLNMLVQINIRERKFTEFHFVDLNLVIRGSFDCCMSLFSKKQDSIEDIRAIVEEEGLYIRPFIVGEDT